MDTECLICGCNIDTNLRCINDCYKPIFIEIKKGDFIKNVLK